MKKPYLFAVCALLAAPLYAADLLNAPPPCVAPADLPGSSSADLDARTEAAAGAVPADINGSPGVNMDIPLYLPQAALASGSASADATATRTPGTAIGTGSAQASGAAAATSQNLPPQLDVPIGGVAIRDGKAASVQVFGQEQLKQAPANGCAH